MIDWNKVSELREEVGPQGFKEVIDLFLDEVEGVLLTLGLPGRRAEPDLHFIRGCASNLGFSDLAQLCSDEELRTQAGETCDATAVERCYRRSKSLFLAGKGLVA
ncbi:Hpt domain-containing protein [Paracoccus sp. p4-l81]|uniref:Hpt domain-containing protein n=1 Tax=unclassified Paracoccus (in: a-proteobacteria) TaxID=2688777 RepID=UPI0035B9A5C6